MPCSPFPTARRGGAEANTRFCFSLQHRGASLRSHATEVNDLQIGRGKSGHDLATLHGKGGKTRQCPLWPETERVRADEILGRAADDAVFVSRLGGLLPASASIASSSVARPGCRHWLTE